jgi:hypothetical protein
MMISFARHQFPPAVIRHVVWLYLRFTLSHRDVEALLAERGLTVSCETVSFKFWATVRPRTSPSAPAANGALASRRDGRGDLGTAFLALGAVRDDG